MISMSRRNLSFVYSVALAAFFLVSPLGCGVPRPGIAEQSQRVDCDGQFTVVFRVTNNAAINEIYDVTATGLGGPDGVNPTFVNLPPTQSGNVTVTGRLVPDFCTGGQVILNAAGRQTSASGGTGAGSATLQPPPVTALPGPPPTAQAQRDRSFTYNFSLRCCSGVTGTFSLEDMASIGIETLRQTDPTLPVGTLVSFTCAGGPDSISTTVMGTVKAEVDEGVVRLGVRRQAPGRGSCGLMPTRIMPP